MPGSAAALRCCVAALALASAPAGAAELARPYDVSSCDVCHASLLGRKHEHVVAGACEECHVPDGARGKCKSAVARRWKLASREPGLCSACHDQGGEAAPHGAISAAGCTACHDAHSSEHRKQLVAWPAAALCASCHGRKDQTKHVHAAVRDGDCLGCHDPHASRHPALLREANGAPLCFRCHEDDATGRFRIHSPVAAGACGACHDPHGGDHAKNLEAPEGQVCARCHAATETGRVRHAAIELEGCTGCHDAHAGSRAALLVADVNPLCQRCHADKTDGRHVSTLVPGGHRIAGVPDPHAPDRPLTCVSCHSPHASASPKLLRFGGDAMEFCDWCHGDRSGKHPELKDIHRVRRPARAGPERAAPP